MAETRTGSNPGVSGQAMEAMPSRSEQAADGDKHTNGFKVALRSNLLFLGAGAPNLAVETVLGRKNRFSMAATGAFTRFSAGNIYALQTLQVGLDAKYWFNPRKGPLTGWHMGGYAIYGGPWDVQWRSGWQGNDFLSAGVSFGYAARIGRSLRLEFAAAGGWFHTSEARRYTPEGHLLMWRQTRRNVDRYSLTRLQINLVWLIVKGKEGGVR